jgi:hypothetical protein
MGPFYPLSSGPDGGPDKRLKSSPDKKCGLFPFYPLFSGPDGGLDKGLKSRPEMPVLSGPFYPVPSELC